MAITLHQFAFSHFNEKARWALAFKGIEHVRRDYLPGPHMRGIRALSGQTRTPVLDWHGDVVAGSSAIIERLETEVPQPPLLPRDALLAAEVRRHCAHFDEEVGPAVRTALFSVLINEPGYICRMFAGRRRWPVRLGYRSLMPLARARIAEGNGVDDPANIERAIGLTQWALDETAERVAAHDYLVGDEFTAADLTAAALFAPIASVGHPDMSRPQPIPSSVARFLVRYQSHPTIEWVALMYRRHRPL